MRKCASICHSTGLPVFSSFLFAIKFDLQFDNFELLRRMRKCASICHPPTGLPVFSSFLFAINFDLQFDNFELLRRMRKCASICHPPTGLPVFSSFLFAINFDLQFDNFELLRRMRRCASICHPPGLPVFLSLFGDYVNSIISSCFGDGASAHIYLPPDWTTSVFIFIRERYDRHSVITSIR